jgi:Tol biopolymer transport system component
LPPRAYLHPRISPNAQQIAIEVEGPNHNIYLYDINRGTFTKMSFDGSTHWPLWTPDGKRLTYRVGMPGPFKMWWMPADRSGAPEQLTTVGEQQSAASWSPDGRVLAFTQVSPQTGGDVYVLEMGGERKPRPFMQSKFDEGSPRFSPDGRWIAYCSYESGRNEIYVQSYPGPGPKIQISTEGGCDPTWKRTGGELYYRNADQMMAVPVTTGPAFTAGKPKLLWERHYNQGTNSMCGAPGPSSSNYDVTADGQRFLMIQEGEQDAPATEIRVVVNWAEELKRIMAETKKP